MRRVQLVESSCRSKVKIPPHPFLVYKPRREPAASGRCSLSRHALALPGVLVAFPEGLLRKPVEQPKPPQGAPLSHGLRALPPAPRASPPHVSLVLMAREAVFLPDTIKN